MLSCRLVLRAVASTVCALLHCTVALKASFGLIGMELAQALSESTRQECTPALASRARCRADRRGDDGALDAAMLYSCSLGFVQ